WITSPKPPLKLYLCDWVQDNLLQYGVILQRSKLGQAYLFENGIILKKEDKLELDKIPFTEDSSTFGIPLKDFKNSKNQHSKTIYCQIIFQTVKITFDLQEIKYLKEFLNAKSFELSNNDSSKNLCKLFGYLLPRTFTLGGVLSKEYILNNNPTDFSTLQLLNKENVPDTPQKIVQLLETWNNKYEDVNTSFFNNK
ncbi:711_t:CDS:2, partial [Scutellospora calospora]